MQTDLKPRLANHSNLGWVPPSYRSPTSPNLILSVANGHHNTNVYGDNRLASDDENRPILDSSLLRASPMNIEDVTMQDSASGEIKTPKNAGISNVGNEEVERSTASDPTQNVEDQQGQRMPEEVHNSSVDTHIPMDIDRIKGEGTVATQDPRVANVWEESMVDTSATVTPNSNPHKYQQNSHSTETSNKNAQSTVVLSNTKDNGTFVQNMNFETSQMILDASTRIHGYNSVTKDINTTGEHANSKAPSSNGEMEEGEVTPPYIPQVSEELRALLVPLLIRNAELRTKLDSDSPQPGKMEYDAKSVLTDEVMETFLSNVNSFQMQMEEKEQGQQRSNFEGNNTASIKEDTDKGEKDIQKEQRVANTSEKSIRMSILPPEMSHKPPPAPRAMLEGHSMPDIRKGKRKSMTDDDVYMHDTYSLEDGRERRSSFSDSRSGYAPYSPTFSRRRYDYDETRSAHSRYSDGKEQPRLGSPRKEESSSRRFTPSPSHSMLEPDAEGSRHERKASLKYSDYDRQRRPISHERRPARATASPTRFRRGRSPESSSYRKHHPYGRYSPQRSRSPPETSASHRRPTSRRGSYSPADSESRYKHRFLGRSGTPEHEKYGPTKHRRSLSTRSSSRRRRSVDLDRDCLPLQSNYVAEIRSRSRRPSHSPQPHCTLTAETKQDQRPNIHEEAKPCYNVPGLWFFKEGPDSVGILECNFEVDQATAMKWNLTSESAFAAEESTTPNISLQILSLPIHLVKEAMESLKSEATPQEIALSLSKVPLQWPPMGDLIIEVNPGTSWEKKWLPNKLGRSNQPVKLDTCVREGPNVVHFIHLSSMKEYMFVLFASQPSKPSPISSAVFYTPDFSHLDKVLAEMHHSLHDSFGGFGLQPAKVELL